MIAVTLLINGCASDMWRPQTSSGEITREQIAPPHDIAIMLPLKDKGELAWTSQAIRNGFLAAYYASQPQSGVNIKVIDTNGGDVDKLYHQAVADGAEIVVGPLTKHEVELIANINPLPVPTIALNTLDDYRHNVRNNLYQFGLLPQDEARQVAVKMAQEQLNNAAIIVPEGLWGDKIVAEFTREYEVSGKQIAATLRYRFGRDLAGQICNFLANDAAKLCTPQKNKKQKKSDEIMRRQDIDAIFFVATTPVQARQIVPLLKFYYAGDLPIYSISTVYGGVSRPYLDQDINGVYFCDMPWVVAPPGSFSPSLQAIHKQIATTTLWAESFASYSKFYALGIDAYNLAVSLNVLLNAPQNGVPGASGTLYLDGFNHIYRELQWSQIRNGVVRDF